MPTTFLLAKVTVATVAAIAALAAGVAVWATSLSPTAPASVIRTDEFSRPAAGRPEAIQVVLGPPSRRGLRQVPCAGGARTTTCYVAVP